jgi:glycosyltransferase involved in cell wall biosynthesis
MLAVVLPTLNAERCLPNSLPALKGETIIVSDGGSTDKTLEIALKAGASLCLGSPGRGPQAARGAKFALMKDADWLLILHSDTQLPENWQSAVKDHIENHTDKVGYFRYAQQAKGLKPWLQSCLVGLRCWAWKLPYGDQGLLISREIYEAIGGYSDLPLFEDVDIMNRLKTHLGRQGIRPLPASVETDVSAYESQGWLRRGWRNYRLMRRYQKGAPVSDLMEIYYND